MTVYEYRKQHPKCGYCKHADVIPFGVTYSCNAKDLLIARGAKKCPIYEPRKDDDE